jgi:mannose-6-phosphate isomerase-like protein (cupin superfamily)
VSPSSACLTTVADPSGSAEPEEDSKVSSFFGSTMLPVPLDLAELTTLVREIAADDAFWRPSLRLPETRSRWWTRLWTDPDVDVWLLSWLPGQGTELHDHGASAAAFAVLAGELTEHRMEAERLVIHPRPAGTTTWVAPGVLHDVHGGGAGPAVSIHAYSPPLTRMNYYDSRGTTVLRSVQTTEPDEPLTR